MNLFLLVAIACADPAAVAPSPPHVEPLMIQIEQTRTCADASQTAVVATTGQGNDQLVALAGARAWLALAEQAVTNEQWESALTCAQGGVDELGKDYKRLTDIDDTKLKLRAVRDAAAEGRTSDAARTLVGVLHSRLALNELLLADQLAK